MQKGPSLLNLVTELPRAVLEISSLPWAMPWLAGMPKGDGHTVMVLPGFMAGDESTLVLRGYLKQLGYDPHGWGLGRNTGRFDIMAQQLPDAFLDLSDQVGGKISLIGQSLGGVFSRELARLYPKQVRQVVSLGSPIQMDDEENVATLVQRLFEESTGLSPEEMREALEFFDTSEPPPVPMTAIYSKGDGIVHWKGCIEKEEGPITQNLRVCGSHCGMGFNPTIFRIIADRLAQDENQWTRFEETALPTLAYGSSK